MGYDMHWRKKDVAEEADVAAARAIWNEAIEARNALPKSEQGTFNIEKAKAGRDWDAHDVYDGRTARYIAAQDAVMAASADVDAAKVSYFRLNIWGMGRAHDLMAELGMTFADDPHPPWPEPEAYGTTHDLVEAVKYPEYDSGVTLTEEQREAAGKYLAEHDRILSWHGRTDTPGIPDHKFSSNDGWIVLPAECEAALRIYTAQLKELGEDAMRNLIDNRFGNRGRWGQWLAYMQGAITHDGFEVH